MQWPARCARCGREIEDWGEAGLLKTRWLHKTCWSDESLLARERGAELPTLRSPAERGRQLELPMAAFALMFHFGLAAAIAGWLMINQDGGAWGAVTLAIGLALPLAGAAGAALNVLARRRVELIRHELDLQGGWKPGR